MRHVIEQDENGFNASLPSTPEAVREALADLRSALSGRGLAEDALGTWELVFAEALNNIVEHAYAERPDGEIRMNMVLQGARMHAKIEDQGFPMPGGTLPEGKAANLDVPEQDLPEGGFGWFLIRSLTEDLRYCRDGATNRLDFILPLEDAG
ncbi:MAG: ATP-binding protein [Pelagimonas sp.]|jgi:serine/threonine-protein kinase RsbW|nr:ATP-binding protein [Pelagimonas sp.]